VAGYGGVAARSVFEIRAFCPCPLADPTADDSFRQPPMRGDQIADFFHPMHAFKRRYYRWLKHIPRRKHLKGGRLHRLFGERLFAPELWRPSRQAMAGGLALGLFIGFTPTMGVQVVLSGIAAVILRVNIPITLAGSLVTNPLTAAIIYPLQYQLGVWMVGLPQASDLQEYSGALRTFMRHAKPLWVGSLVTGGVAALLGYGLVSMLWQQVHHLRSAGPQAPGSAPVSGSRESRGREDPIDDRQD
jgi:uncharacterized protein (DUF2062 family)